MGRTPWSAADAYVGLLLDWWCLEERVQGSAPHCSHAGAFRIP